MEHNVFHYFNFITIRDALKILRTRFSLSPFATGDATWSQIGSLSLGHSSLNAPFDPPSLSRSIPAPFERSSRLFDSLGSRAIVSACPTSVSFRVLYEGTGCVNTNKGNKFKD